MKNKYNSINITIDFLEDILHSLESMKYYADDGIVSRNDPDFKEFYNEVDQAQVVIDKINELLWIGDE